MSHWVMLVRMRVWLAGRIRSLMSVSMVDVMHMRMRMDDSFVNMLVLVMFRQVQPYADCHQDARDRSCDVTGSPNPMTAIALPMKGAVEKYAPVRAVPRSRKATTKSAR